MTPAEARRVFLICHGLRWLPTGLLVPIMVLLLTERGLSLTEVGFVFAAYGGVTAVLELPTGGLADAIGRKPVLLVATLFDAALAAGLLFGHALWVFLLAAALGAVGRALLSGPLESWYVDTARTADPAVVLRPALSAAGIVEALALAAGALLSALLPLAGTGLPLDGTISLLTLPILAALVAQVLSFAAVMLLVVEGPRRRRAGRLAPSAAFQALSPAACGSRSHIETYGSCSRARSSPSRRWSRSSCSGNRALPTCSAAPTAPRR